MLAKEMTATDPTLSQDIQAWLADMPKPERAASAHAIDGRDAEMGNGKAFVKGRFAEMGNSENPPRKPYVSRFRREEKEEDLER